MLQIFRNNQLPTAVLLILIALPFIWAKSSSTADASLSNYPDWLIYLNKSTAAPYIFGSLLLLEAFWLNFLVNFYRIGKKTSFYTALIFLLSIFSFQQDALLSPALFSNLLIIAAIQQFFRAYDNKSSVKEVFNAALYCGIAVVINPAALFYIPFCIAAWLKVRSFSGKEFAVLLIGLFIPFYLFGTYMYLTASLENWLQYSVAGLGPMKSFFRLNTSFWISISVNSLLLLISILNYSGIKGKTNIREQKYIDLLFFLLFFTSFFWLGNARIGFESLQLISLPLSIFISLNFQALKNSKLAEIMFLLLLAAALFSGLGNLILEQS